MDCLRIERLTNGYLIRVDDPKIVAANRKSKGGEYRDPERKFVFDDVKGVMAWLEANIDKALPKDDFDTAFDNAALEEETNDDE